MQHRWIGTRLISTRGPIPHQDWTNSLWSHLISRRCKDERILTKYIYPIFSITAAVYLQTLVLDSSEAHLGLVAHHRHVIMNRFSLKTTIHLASPRHILHSSEAHLCSLVVLSLACPYPSCDAGDDSIDVQQTITEHYPPISITSRHHVLDSSEAHLGSVVRSLT